MSIFGDSPGILPMLRVKAGRLWSRQGERTPCCTAAPAAGQPCVGTGITTEPRSARAGRHRSPEERCLELARRRWLGYSLCSGGPAGITLSSALLLRPLM